MGRGHLLDQQQAATWHEPLAYPLDQPFAIQGSDELQGQDQADDRGVLDHRAAMQVRELPLDVALHAYLLDLGAGLAQHRVRVIDANEADLLVYELIERYQGRSGRTTQVIKPRPGLGEVPCRLADHSLDLVVERHRALDHVIKDTGDLIVETEVQGRTTGVDEDLVTRRFRRIGLGWAHDAASDVKFRARREEGSMPSTVHSDEMRVMPWPPLHGDVPAGAGPAAPSGSRWSRR